MMKSDNTDKTEAIYAAILDNIIHGELEPGHHLVEEQLAKQYHVSRTPIRDALLSLVKDGLIERKRGCGARVTTFSPDDVEEIYEIRKALECCSVRNAGRTLRLSDLAVVKHDLEQALQKRGPTADHQHVQIDFRLHKMIVDGSGNKRLISYMKNISHLLDTLRLMNYRGYQHHREVGEEHLAIVNALMRRNGVEAERLLANHIDTGRLAALGLFLPRAHR